GMLLAGDMGGAMHLRKGMRVRELTKRVGQAPRVGRVRGVHDRSVEVEWEDGHVSSVSGAYLFPVERPATKKT
ncbi:MAG: hypothetical protein KJ698_05965, partial [Actinobacteria bacterium]|nr:hypothetical protein [Actinomycetota bacterium]